VRLRLPHRLHSGLRLIAYAILALSLLLRPVLASLGEMHELAHDPSGSHLDVGHFPGSAAQPPADEGSDQSALHTLLHFAHCCGQLSAGAVSVAIDTLTPPADVRVLSFRLAAVPSTRWQTPFRPPIAT
jgi:hypothetical protein